MYVCIRVEGLDIPSAVIPWCLESIASLAPAIFDLGATEAPERYFKAIPFFPLSTESTSTHSRMVAELTRLILLGEPVNNCCAELTRARGISLLLEWGSD